MRSKTPETYTNGTLKVFNQEIKTCVFIPIEDSIKPST